MTNVIEFPRQHSEVPKFINDTAENWQLPPIVKQAFLSLGNAKTLETASDNYFRNLEFVRSDAEFVFPDHGTKTGGVLTVNSTFRRNLVEEFGIQGHTNFLKLDWVIEHPLPENETPITYDDACALLTEYTVDQFSDLPASNIISLAYSMFVTLCSETSIQLTYVSLDKDVFKATFDTKSVESKDNICYHLIIDMLPLVLNHAAYQFWETKIKEPELCE